MLKLRSEQKKKVEQNFSILLGATFIGIAKTAYFVWQTTLLQDPGGDLATVGQSILYLWLPPAEWRCGGGEDDSSIQEKLMQLMA